MINPFTDEYSDKVFDITMAVKKLIEDPEIGSLGASLVYLIAATDYLKQKAPATSYDCDRFLGELRRIAGDHYPTILGNFLSLFPKDQEEDGEMAKIFQFPQKAKTDK